MKPTQFRFTGAILLLAAICGPVAAQSSPELCGDLANGFGPHDYRVDRQHLPIVESAHFTPAVESLVRGNTSNNPLGDLDYTLRAFPNHHRALISMMRYGEKTKSTNPGGSKRSIECYFERAVRFRPDDTVARMLFAQYLFKLTRPDDARTQLQWAAHAAKDNAFTHYNIGLIYAEAKDYPRALEQAHKAIALGFGRTQLREQLVAAGQWKEPDAAVAQDAAASAPASTAPAKP